jgi:DNA-binding beta-propeller fold protein YncE
MTFFSRVFSGSAAVLCSCAQPSAPPPNVSAKTPDTSSATTTPEASAAAPSAVMADSEMPAGPALAALVFEQVALPAVHAPAAVDYIAYEPGRERVWVPVANTGSVDVFDIATRTFTRIDGFTTSELEVKGTKRTMGPSSVAIGDGFAYVGNRATQEVCSVSTSTLTIGICLKLPSATDGVAYVASAKEVWVTTPRAQAIAVLDASKPDALVSKATVKLDGAPEGYALDDRRGLFFTNLEDRNKTVVIDIKSHKSRATWSLYCSSDGPRGIAADAKRGFVYVACTDQVLVLDGARNGAKLATLDTGGGVDNVDWIEARQLLYVAAGKAATLTVAHVDDQGQPSVVARNATANGARNGVADASGNAYVVDRANARLLAFTYTR